MTRASPSGDVQDVQLIGHLPGHQVAAEAIVDLGDQRQAQDVRDQFAGQRRVGPGVFEAGVFDADDIGQIGQAGRDGSRCFPDGGLTSRRARRDG